MAISRGIWRERNRRIFNAKSKDYVSLLIVINSHIAFSAGNAGRKSGGKDGLVLTEKETRKEETRRISVDKRSILG